MNEREQILAECARREREPPKKEPPTYYPWSYNQWLDQMEFGPLYHTGQWFDSVTEAQRQRFVRAVKRLDADKLITIHRVNGRMRHIKLTAAGQRQVKRLKSHLSGNEGNCHMAKG